MAQEKTVSRRPNIVVRRRWYDDDYGQGIVELEVDGRLHRFRVYRNPKGKGFIIEHNGLKASFSEFRELLEGTELEPYARLVRKYVRSAIYEALLRESKRHRVVFVKSVETGAGRLDVGLRDDGNVVLRLGGKRVVTNKDGIANKLAELVPLDAMSPELVDQVRRVLSEIERGVLAGREVTVILDGEARDAILPSVVVSDRLVVMLPFVASYLEEGEARRGLLALVIVSDSNGNIETVDYVRNPVTVEAGDKTVYRDFLDRVALSEALERVLPGAELVRRIGEGAKSGRNVTWSEALELAERLIDKYAYVEGRNRTLAALYTIAQTFYDLVPIFPILRIIGEMGSGKRQLANAIAASAPVSITVVQPTEAALYRLVDAFHPLLIIDESKINEDMALLLNAGYERDKFVPRARVTENGKTVIEVFNFYSPKIIVSRPGKLNLPEDTVSRTIEVYMQRVTGRVFPPEVDPRDHEEAVATLLLLKARRWREFLEAYNQLKEVLVGVDPRARDTYLPLLTVAYLATREKGDLSLFTEVLEDMAAAAEERAGVAYHQKLAIVGILRHLTGNTSLDGVVKLVSVSVKDIESALGMRLDSGLKVKIGKFLNEAPFKTSKNRSGGYTRYVVDVEKLYQYVKSYNVDLSMLSGEELERLEKATSLDWRGIGFNRDEWAKSIIGKLFGGNNGGSPGTPSTPSTESRDEPEASAQGNGNRGVEGGEKASAPPTPGSVEGVAEGLPPSTSDSGVFTGQGR